MSFICKTTEAAYPFFLLWLYFFFLNLSQQYSRRMEMFILFHLFACLTNTKFWKILYLNESDTFFKRKWVFWRRHSSPLSCSSLSGLQRKHCCTVLMSFQVKKKIIKCLICCMMWVNKGNLPLDSRLVWTVDKFPIAD